MRKKRLNNLFQQVLSNNFISRFQLSPEHSCYGKRITCDYTYRPGTYNTGILVLCGKSFHITPYICTGAGRRPAPTFYALPPLAGYFSLPPLPTPPDHVALFHSHASRGTHPCPSYSSAPALSRAYAAIVGAPNGLTSSGSQGSSTATDCATPPNWGTRRLRLTSPTSPQTAGSRPPRRIRRS